MAIVKDEPGFTQLTKLNVIDKLCIDGQEIEPFDPEFIIEETVPYTLDGTEDSLKLTGTGNLTLISAALAIKSIVVYAATGTVTVVPVGGDTVSQVTLGVGNSARYTPFTGEWVAT